jgi:hypothetical protein
LAKHKVVVYCFSFRGGVPLKHEMNRSNLAVVYKPSTYMQVSLTFSGYWYCPYILRPKNILVGSLGSLLTFSGCKDPQSHTLFLLNVLAISSLAVMLGLSDFMVDFCPAYFILAWLTELQ